MKIIKRNGSEETFNISKITNAVRKANAEVLANEQLSEEQIETISKNVAVICQGIGHTPSVEEIQDLVENQIMAQGAYSVARRYITYRYTRTIVRQSNTTDEQILSLLKYENEEVKQENSNKNPQIVSVQRDYMAGEVSKDITKRFLLPNDIWEAHEEGIIHFHDADYFAQTIHNCELLNLNDMLQNGTSISGTMIDSPKSFATACTVTSQIVAQVASSSYGGQTFTLSHLVPFVDISRQKIRKRFAKELEDIGIPYTEEQLDAFTKKELQKEIDAGIQTIQYQLITLQTTNG